MVGFHQSISQSYLTSSSSGNGWVEPGSSSHNQHQALHHQTAGPFCHFDCVLCKVAPDPKTRYWKVEWHICTVSTSGGGFGLCRATTSFQASSRCNWYVSNSTHFTQPGWKLPAVAYFGVSCFIPTEGVQHHWKRQHCEGLLLRHPTSYRNPVCPSNIHFFFRIVRQARWRPSSTGVEEGAQAGRPRAKRRWSPLWNRTLSFWPHTFK